jgi:hypothetical protein
MVLIFFYPDIVVFSGNTEAWYQKAGSFSNFSPSIFGQGIRLIRSWEEVEKFQKKEKKTSATKLSDDIEEPRVIDHLVLVVHGIGQKLGESIVSPDISEDTIILRTFKINQRQLAKLII